jgi:hypothetical protein
LRDVTIDHPRLADFRDRQIMDLSTNPREERVEVEHKGQRHLIDFNRAALNAIHAKLIDWGIAPDAFAWPPRHNPKALPYPGLDRSAIADYRKALSVRIDEPTKKQIERALKELGVAADKNAQ